MGAPLWPTGASAADTSASSTPGPWSTVKLAGKALPGRAEIVSGGEVARAVDVKKPSGKDGATITDRGVQPSQVRIRVSLWTAQHLSAWESMLPSIQPRAGKGGMQRVSIYHPSLAMNGISRVCVSKIGALRPSSTAGVYEAEIDCVQWMPGSKKNATKTVTASQAEPSIASLDDSGSGFGGLDSRFAFTTPAGAQLMKPSETESAP